MVVQPSTTILPSLPGIDLLRFLEHRKNNKTIIVLRINSTKMELVTFESEAYKEIIRNINEIKSNLNNKGNNTPLSETWLDIQETCQLLKISKRTLQSYRDNGILPFSQIGGKIYFRAGDIEDHLKKHYIKAFNPKK